MTLPCRCTRRPRRGWPTGSGRAPRGRGAHAGDPVAGGVRPARRAGSRPDPHGRRCPDAGVPRGGRGARGQGRPGGGRRDPGGSARAGRTGDAGGGVGGAHGPPGLADNHYHGIGGGPGVDLSGARSLADIIDAVAATARETPPGEVIVTNSDWHEGQLTEQRLPYRDDLDLAAPEHPVVVVRGGHQYVLNSAALAHWRIDESTPEVPGGRIGRDPDGRLNGELVDRAKDLVTLPARPIPDPATLLDGLAAEHAPTERARPDQHPLPGRVRRPVPRARAPEGAGPVEPARRLPAARTARRRRDHDDRSPRDLARHG